jgi:fused signal recognition particle receptor
MFSFFKKKTTAPAQPPVDAPVVDAAPAAVAPAPDAAPTAPAPAPWAGESAVPPVASLVQPSVQPSVPPSVPPVEPAAGWWKTAVGKLTGSAPITTPAPALPPPPAALPQPAPPPPSPPRAEAVPVPVPVPALEPTPEPAPATPPPATRQSWLDKLRNGLRKTGSSIAQVFTGTQIDEALYEELEAALLMADAGVKATEFLLSDLKRRVKDSKTADPAVVKALLGDALAELLAPLEKSLEIGRHQPLVMMVVGVNGAGKTTSIGKLTRHLADAEQTVLLAAADTFRAAAREQLAVWADRNRVEIVSQEGADPAAVAFDAVSAGKARGRDVVIADTAGRLPTQLHLMEELKKIKRVITKAEAGAPHEVLLVVDGNTGQNALTQVKAFDDALGLTGLVITKLDGTAKGGVLAAIARERPIPVYFIGVGEKLEDLQTFNAREFAQALLA